MTTASRWALAATCADCLNAQGGTALTLVKDSRPAAVIVLATNATVSAQLGARELQGPIRRMTGAELQWVDETTGVETDKIGLYIGDTRKVNELGLSQVRFTNQEHAIRWLADGIVFADKDQADRRTLTYDAANLPGLLDERGSADAVYRSCRVM